MNIKEVLLELIFFILYFIFFFLIGSLLSILNLSKINNSLDSKLNSYWITRKNKKNFKSSYK